MKNPRDISVFAHEVSHAAIFGLDIHDVPFFHRSRDGVVNSEALSYLIGELTENLLKKYTSKR